MGKVKKSTVAKPWEKTGASIVQPVLLNVLTPLQSFLIICEGVETERRYFESFRANKKVEDFKVEGIGANTEYVVHKAIKIRDELNVKREEPFDQVWCVFDRDDFPAANFNSAIQLAMTNGIRIAYTNEAFEFWYLLHFEYHTTAYSRTQYKGKLTDRFNKRYEKNAPDTYEILQTRGNEAQAMRFADRLLQEHQQNSGRINPERDNPSTTVHCLVRELRNQGERFVRSSEKGTRTERDMYKEVFESLRPRNNVESDELIKTS